MHEIWRNRSWRALISKAMNSTHWYPAYRWSESHRIYEMLAIFRYEIDAREWENRIGVEIGTSARPTDPELRDAKWARKLLGYKIMFSEIAVYDWLAKRSVGRVR
jgi:hypothetical protein